MSYVIRPYPKWTDLIIHDEDGEKLVVTKFHSGDTIHIELGGATVIATGRDLRALENFFL